MSKVIRVAGNALTLPVFYALHTGEWNSGLRMYREYGVGVRCHPYEFHMLKPQTYVRAQLEVHAHVNLAGN